MRKHRVQVDDLWRLALPVTHQLDGVALPQLHARDDGSHLNILSRACQAIFQQRSDQRLPLTQADLAAQSGQHESVAAQTRRGVQYARTNTRLDAYGFGDHLPAAAAELAPVSSTAFDEIHPNRSWSLITKLLELQAAFAKLQRELGLLHLQGKAQAYRPSPCLFVVFRRQRLYSHQWK